MSQLWKIILGLLDNASSTTEFKNLGLLDALPSLVMLSIAFGGSVELSMNLSDIKKINKDGI